MELRHKIVVLILLIINFLICFNSSYLATNIIYFSILTICTIFIFKENYFSLKKIFLLFFYFFFGVSPIVQLNNNIFFFESKSVLNKDDFFFGGVLLLHILIIYLLLSFFLEKKITKPTSQLSINFKRIVFFKDFYIQKVIRILALVNLLFLMLNSFNIENFYTIILENNEGYKFYVVTFFKDVLRFIPIIILLLIKGNAQVSKRFELLLLINVIALNFPTGISRYQLAVVYFPLLIKYCYLIKKFFSYSFFIALLVIFPYFHEFRYDFSFKRNHYNFFKMFSELHFDTFQNTLSIIKLNIITYGEQAIGTLFFMIPRYLWDSKPMSSSYVLCEKLNYNGFCNIAISFIGEGYLNLGYIGVLLLLFIIVLINSYLDIIYRNKIGGNLFNAFYLFILFWEFYALRGSMTSSYVKLSIIILAFFLTVFLLQFNMKKSLG